MARNSMKKPRPSIDHSLLSPSGKISKAARKRAMERYGKEVEEWEASQVETEEEKQVRAQDAQDSKRRQDLSMAKKLHGFADNGFGPKKHRKEALRLEAKWGTKRGEY